MKLKIKGKVGGHAIDLDLWLYDAAPLTWELVDLAIKAAAKSIKENSR